VIQDLDLFGSGIGSAKKRRRNTAPASADTTDAASVTVRVRALTESQPIDSGAQRIVAGIPGVCSPGMGTGVAGCHD
jgi:hypothetical protein